MPKKQPKFISVAERALVARIQRKLKANDEKLVKVRPGTEVDRQFGTYYIVCNDTIIDSGLELEALGRRLDALKPYEKLQN